MPAKEMGRDGVKIAAGAGGQGGAGGPRRQTRGVPGKVGSQRDGNALW